MPVDSLSMSGSADVGCLLSLSSLGVTGIPDIILGEQDLRRSFFDIAKI